MNNPNRIMGFKIRVSFTKNTVINPIAKR